MSSGPRVRFAHAVERWYFWEPCFCFSIFGDIKPTFGQFLEHFCYMLRNGPENKTYSIPLGIIIFLFPWESFFLLKLSSSLFFWPEMSFFSLKSVNFLFLILKFFQILCPKNTFFFFWSSAPAFFFSFLNWSIFGPHTSYFPPI